MSHPLPRWKPVTDTAEASCPGFLWKSTRGWTQGKQQICATGAGHCGEEGAGLSQQREVAPTAPAVAGGNRKPGNISKASRSSSSYLGGTKLLHKHYLQYEPVQRTTTFYQILCTNYVTTTMEAVAFIKYRLL